MIFHCYSKALHTVTLEKDNENGDYKVVLVFELEVDGLKQLYDYCGSKKYIIDEIYNRTIKMELERRYCMKFIYPYLNIGRLDIRINIYGGQQFELIKKLNYVLEDVCYPETSVMSQLDELKRRGCPSGEQLLTDLGLCEVSDEKND